MGLSTRRIRREGLQCQQHKKCSGALNLNPVELDGQCVENLSPPCIAGVEPKGGAIAAIAVINSRGSQFRPPAKNLPKHNIL